MILTCLGLLVVLGLGVRFLYFSNFSTIENLGERSMPAPTVAQVVGVITPTVIIHEPTPTATTWPTPIILEREVIVQIPVEVTRESTVYRDVYITVPQYVTTTIEVTPVPLPTATIVPLSPGTVQICVRVEGAREIYIGGAGVVSGGCQTYAFGVGQTAIQVHVNK
jgi:hypothetical protein